MNRHWLKICGTLLLSATTALAQSALDSAFDGRGATGLEMLRPESVLPVIRETRETAPQPDPSLLPVLALQAQEPAVPVAIEILVPAASRQPEAVLQGLGRLASDYRFAPDADFAPVRLPQFQVMPFPPLPQTRNAYLIRGQVPADRLEELRRDPSVRGFWHAQPSGEKGIEELFLRHHRALANIPGVRNVYSGFDCGSKDEHYHVLPHRPALVIELDGAVAPAAVRQAVFQELPELALEPVAFLAAAVSGAGR
ncbi:MAG: hypothetical protein HY554_10400 [Elusimicrobia bacterium]|nr:hypothetical protein [Elusimicrobiota bacterium]